MISPRRIVIPIIAASLAVAGCSSSTHTAGGSSTSSGSATTSGQPTGSPILVGAICSCSGAYGPAFLGGEDAFKAWVQTVNASGGIEGHPVQLIEKDDGGTPATGITEINSLISDHVVAIVDNALIDSPWVPTLQQAGIAAIGGTGTQSLSPINFPTGTTNDVSAVSSVATIKASGETKVGYLYPADVPTSINALQGLKAELAKEGLDLVYSAGFSSAAPNYTSQCLAAQAAHVTILDPGGQPSQIEGIASDCYAQGFKPAYFSQWVKSMETSPALTANTWGNSPVYPWFGTLPELQTANAAVDKYFPGLRDKPTTPSILIPQFWAAGLMLQDALTKGGLTAGGTATASMVLNGLYKFNGDTLHGITAPLSFKEGQPQKNDCWFSFHVSNGTSAILNNGQATCKTA